MCTIENKEHVQIFTIVNKTQLNIHSFIENKIIFLTYDEEFKFLNKYFTDKSNKSNYELTISFSHISKTLSLSLEHLPSFSKVYLLDLKSDGVVDARIRGDNVEINDRYGRQVAQLFRFHRSRPS